MKKTPRLLFIVNGLGLGNATRCYAIMQELATQNIAIDVIASQNAYVYLKPKREVQNVYEAPQPKYPFDSKGGVSPILLLRQFPMLVGELYKRRKTLLNLISTINPDMVVLDSQYVGPIKNTSTRKWIAINNSSEVMRGFWRTKLNHKILIHFLLVELSDYLYHKLFVEKKLVQEIPGSQTLTQARVLVRKEIVPSSRNDFKRIVVMVSGSNDGSFRIFPEKWHFDVPIDVIGQDGQDTRWVKYHGKVMNSWSLLEKADLLIINAGLSSISEVLAMKKLAIVVPISGHAEQYVNASFFEKLDVGLVSSLDNLEESIKLILSKKNYFTKKLKQLVVDRGVAKDFANLIIREIAGLR